MPNIKFSYLYRDAANNKNFNAIIFDNPNNVDLSNLERLIRSKLIDGTWFYVNEWQLPDLHFRNYDDRIDHAWHEFESVEYSEELLNLPLNLAELIIKVESTNWYNKKMGINL